MNLKRRYTCDFEEYQNNQEDMQNQEIHIYIAIQD
jgi:predicted transcriptional regulator YdeE